MNERKRNKERKVTQINKVKCRIIDFTLINKYLAFDLVSLLFVDDSSPFRTEREEKGKKIEVNTQIMSFHTKSTDHSKDKSFTLFMA